MMLKITVRYDCIQHTTTPLSVVSGFWFTWCQLSPLNHFR